MVLLSLSLLIVRQRLRGWYGAAGTGRRAGTSGAEHPDCRFAGHRQLIPFTQIVWRTNMGWVVMLDASPAKYCRVHA